jgi:rhamnose utilization protein RhaD (predicted bifunctional aldolase and dehydrogenase)/NAD(P)-dependent dehydrogenase (short-subunit alcohol dehydrogenase family)
MPPILGKSQAGEVLNALDEAAAYPELMENRWNDADADGCLGDVAQRVYTSRLIGGDPALVLHGGGNTSVKVRQPDIFGTEENLLYVKGSGFDLHSITADGFAPVRVSQLTKLARLDQLTDLEMARQLRLAMAEPQAPAPSVEAILHAVLPHRFVDHAHADAVISLTNTPSGDRHVRAAYGDQVLVIPYVMPGFELSRVAARIIEEGLRADTRGLILLGHGLFSFGDTARQSYDRLIDLVTVAEDYLKAHDAWDGTGIETEPGELAVIDLAAVRADACAVAGFPLILARQEDPLGLAFARDPEVASLSQRGPATPDHAIRTKRLPLLGRDVLAYAREYRGYFERSAARHPAGAGLQMLDPAPRVILDEQFGLCSLGRSAADATATAEIYHHTIEVIRRAQALEQWKALSPEEIFAVEYWDLEQAKIRRRGPVPEFAGEIALVTGAASGIGRACAQALARDGAAVCGVDINPAVDAILPGPAYVGVAGDLGAEEVVAGAVDTAVRRFGGLDILILCAGIFPSSARIESLSGAEWSRTFQVNADANLALLRTAYPYLRLAPRGGRVVIIASKNVPAPGPGAAAYSASKAALTQLARVAALEWGQHNIRVNVLHPNAVFDTGIWTEEVIAQRAAEYGISAADYRKRNVLGTEVHSTDVAALAAAMCGKLFATVTGAQLPVDGGNERVI